MNYFSMASSFYSQFDKNMNNINTNLVATTLECLQLFI